MATKNKSAKKSKSTRAPRARKEGPTLPQIRVMRVLHKAGGPLTRAAISAKIGNKTTVVAGRAVGYSDEKARKAFEQTKDGGGSPGNPRKSLLTLGWVREVEVDVDGHIENSVELTAAGKHAYAKLDVKALPALRD